MRSSVSNKPYDSKFYKNRSELTFSSAEVIVPWLLRTVKPKSVIDIGCGNGCWLAVFQKHGLQDFLGVDGNWVPSDQLEIPASHFEMSDLLHAYKSNRAFNLVMSLEVAEHLPPRSAPEFIKSLTALGPVVLFGAAIPLQGGVGHINEQWPAYWIELFEKQNYVAVDCLRGLFWKSPGVAAWYVQNTFFFIREDVLNDYPELLEEEKKYSMGKHPIVHPSQYLRRIDELRDPMTYSVKSFLKVAPHLLKRAFVKRCKHLVGKNGR